MTLSCHILLIIFRWLKTGIYGTSEVRRREVDQGVVGSNPAHGSKYFLPHVFHVYSAHLVKWVPAFGGGMLHIELEIRIRVYALRWLDVVSDYTDPRI